MKLIVFVLLLSCVIEYQYFVQAGNCPNSNCCERRSNSNNCNNKCNTGCKENCSKSNCNKSYCDEYTSPPPVYTTTTSATITKPPITRTPSTDELNIDIKVSNKIETTNNVNVPIGISLENKNNVTDVRNTSAISKECCGNRGHDCGTPVQPENPDVEIITCPPPPHLEFSTPPPALPPIVPLPPTLPLPPPLPPIRCVQPRTCPPSQWYNNPWSNYYSQFPQVGQGQVGTPIYGQSYPNQFQGGQYNFQGLQGFPNNYLQG